MPTSVDGISTKSFVVPRPEPFSIPLLFAGVGRTKAGDRGGWGGRCVKRRIYRRRRRTLWMTLVECQFSLHGEGKWWYGAPKVGTNLLLQNFGSLRSVGLNEMPSLVSVVAFWAEMPQRKYS